MLLNPSALNDNLRHPVDATVRETYITLANAQFPEGLTVRPTGHGYIARELRFEFHVKLLFSAILNQKRVLWYFRKLAMNEGLLNGELTRASFPTAESNNRSEIKLRIKTAKKGLGILDWIASSGVQCSVVASKEQSL